MILKSSWVDVGVVEAYGLDSASIRIAETCELDSARLYKYHEEYRSAWASVDYFSTRSWWFLKTPQPYSYANYPSKQVSNVTIPREPPFSTFEDHTQPPQALLYRLSGDYNPLHSDPMIAKVAGFSQPILPGLCTLGHAVRTVIKHISKGDPNTVKSIFGRFLLHVYPGETLVIEMWLQGLRYLMKLRGVNKEPGCSWIELKDGVHVFVVGDQMHLEIDEIRSELRILSRLMKDEGYWPDFDLTAAEALSSEDDVDQTACEAIL